MPVLSVRISWSGQQSISRCLAAVSDLTEVSVGSNQASAIKTHCKVTVHSKSASWCQCVPLRLLVFGVALLRTESDFLLNQVKGKGASGSFVVVSNAGKTVPKARDRKVRWIILNSTLKCIALKHLTQCSQHSVLLAVLFLPKYSN